MTFEQLREWCTLLSALRNHHKLKSISLCIHAYPPSGFIVQLLRDCLPREKIVVFISPIYSTPVLMAQDEGDLESAVELSTLTPSFLNVLYEWSRMMLPLLLVVLLAVPLTPYRQLNRLLVTLLACLIVGHELGFNLDAKPRTVGPETELEIRQRAIDFFEHPEHATAYNSSALLKFARDFSEAALRSTYMPGMLHAFKDVYRNVTLIYRNGCLLIGAADDNTHISPDERPYVNVEEDPVFRKLTDELAALSEVVREVILLPNVQFISDISSFISRWRKTIVAGGSMEIFKADIKTSLKHYRSSRRWLRRVECPKCAKFEWEDLWCDRKTGVCNTVDPVARLPYFYDQHHPNYFGSMFVGRFFRQRYDLWLAERNSRATKNEGNGSVV
ncbi:hypothetical protein M3Y99_01829200 [Aphelenchoides fujianensis]|nr:hypothetical protein M3Y99_01829200 [Aphelenchoides fujianensis]